MSRELYAALKEPLFHGCAGGGAIRGIESKVKIAGSGLLVVLSASRLRTAWNDKAYKTFWFEEPAQ